jgi:predicted PurR-regulated permease PerM
MEHRAVTITPKTLWMVLAFAVGVFVAWKLRNFIMVVIVSVIIASFIEAGTKILKRVRVPRVISVFIFYILGFAMLFGILYLIVPLFLNELSSFVDLFPPDSALAQLLGSVADNGFSSATFREILQSNNLLSGTGAFAHSFQGIFGGVLNALLVLIISFYLSIQEKGIEQFLRVVTPEKYEEYVVDVWTRTEKKIGYWFGGQALVAVLVGLVTYIGLFLMGVPYALILAALSFVFEFFPFGTVLALAPAVVLGYLGGGFGLALQIFILYGIVHYIEAYFLQPYILHRTIGMPMLVIILSVIACFELFGIIGILIAIPIAVLVLELIYDQGLAKFKRKLPNG